MTEPLKENMLSNTIFPVILSVPQTKRTLKGRSKVEYLSELARSAVEVSAGKNNINFSDVNLIKNNNGVPIPFDGYFWSLSHKNDYVGGVVASHKIGIDIEKIRPFAPGLYKKTASENEWNLSDNDKEILFFRYWTAKEAVIKAVGSGLKDLLKCRVEKIIDKDNLVIKYNNKDWYIECFVFNGHISSIVKNDKKVKWTLME